MDHKLGIIIANDVCQDRIDMFQLKPDIGTVEKKLWLIGMKICGENGIIVENIFIIEIKSKVDCIYQKQ